MVDEIRRHYSRLNKKGRRLALAAIKAISCNKGNVRESETTEERFERETDIVLNMVASGQKKRPSEYHSMTV